MPLAQLKQLARMAISLPSELAKVQESLSFLREAVGRVESRLDPTGSERGELASHEFKVYSQWGEDGILQHLINSTAIPRKVFVEFGVQNYLESNTRFLLQNDYWSGLILDGSEFHIDFIRNDPIYWRHNLKAVRAFVTRENINDLLRENGLAGEIGLLSIDIDGNDYWVWEAISVVNPALVVIEYNARFGPERSVTVPYDPAFVREKAHYSCIYYGASLSALAGLGRRKGYAFVGSNRAANNAFFIRNDLLPANVRAIAAAEGWRACGFRESRNPSGQLAFLSAEEEAKLLMSLPLVEVEP
jgi:hypothetical protein